MSEIKVYTTRSHDGVIRMALHPMDAAPCLGKGGKNQITFSFRVTHTKAHWNNWRRSCRGKGRNTNTIPGNGSDRAAICWLLAGE